MARSRGSVFFQFPALFSPPEAMSLLVSTKIVGQRGSCRVLIRDWRIVSLAENGDITFTDLFKGILARQFDAHDTFLLPSEFLDQPVTCELAPTKVSSEFQQVPLHVKVAEATPVFGIYIKFCIQCALEKEGSEVRVHDLY